jgi:hypothetical protein
MLPFAPRDGKMMEGTLDERSCYSEVGVNKQFSKPLSASSPSELLDIINIQLELSDKLWCRGHKISCFWRNRIEHEIGLLRTNFASSRGQTMGKVTPFDRYQSECLSPMRSAPHLRSLRFSLARTP